MPDKPWYVEITRDQQHLDDPAKVGDPMENIVIGPFDTEDAAQEYGQNSADVEDWCYGEAKAKGYIVDDVTWTQTPIIPSYGINAPMTDKDWVVIGKAGEEPAPQAVGIRLLADYQMLGDEDGWLWAEEVLGDAQQRGDITSFKVLSSLKGIYGVQCITFTVDVGFSGPFTREMDYDEFKATAENFLNGQIIHDADVDLRFLSPLHESDIIPHEEGTLGALLHDQPIVGVPCPDHPKETR